jgi:hypothetical protein
MRDNDLVILGKMTRAEIEIGLNLHTTQRVRPDKYTEFSWSASRHSLFEWCRRKYYLHYYGSRRVQEARDRAVSGVWWLKQVITRQTWIGSVIHLVAQKAVQAIQAGQALPADQVVDMATAAYHEGLRASKRGAKYDNRWVILFEDIYPQDLPSINLSQAEMRVRDLAQGLLDSDAFAFICRQPGSAIREVDNPFQSFTLSSIPVLGQVRIYAIPDVLIHTGDEITIIDWKTGDPESETIPMQAGIYRLYAHRAYGLPEDSIRVQIADLNTGENVDPVGGTPPATQAEASARASIQSMLDHLEDVRYNTVNIRSCPRAEDRSRCLYCGFKRICWQGDNRDE